VTAGRYAGGGPVAEVVRSGFVESRHDGSVAVLDPGAQLVAGIGDPHGPVFPRSANKPMQAVAMLRAGLDVDDADLAVVAASHSAEPSHVERVQAMLARAGLDESALACPPDLPLSAAARADILRRGGRPARILMNCSGKHAGMLLTCLASGWSTVDYVDPGHPLQVACRSAVEELAGEPITSVGIDGCGAPVYALSLAGLARAFLACVEASPGTPARRVADAMRAYPELMSGTGREDATLMRAVPGLLAKGGAEGVMAVAVPGVGGVAVKIDDGSERARMPVLVAALRRLGVVSPVLDRLGQVPILGGGRVVGEVRVPDSLSRDLGLLHAS
jgi:L-asparaginase II